MADLIGRSLLAGLVGPVQLVMVGVLAEGHSKVPFAVDQHPIGALGSCGAYPCFGVAVRAWRRRRSLIREWSPAGQAAAPGGACGAGFLWPGVRRRVPG